MTHTWNLNNLKTKRLETQRKPYHANTFLRYLPFSRTSQSMPGKPYIQFIYAIRRALNLVEKLPLIALRKEPPSFSPPTNALVRKATVTGWLARRWNYCTTCSGGIIKRIHCGLPPLPSAQPPPRAPHRFLVRESNLVGSFVCRMQWMWPT